MNIFVDVDGVCADLITPWLAWYNETWDDSLKPEDITEWRLEPFVKKECGKQIEEFLLKDFIYNSVKPIPGALEGIRMLREKGHRVIFATSETIGMGGRKLSWLIDNYFLDQDIGQRYFDDYIEVHDKGLLAGHVLIDDNPDNIMAFKGIDLLFDQPWNRNFRWTWRAKGWKTVARKIDSLMRSA